MYSQNIEPYWLFVLRKHAWIPASINAGSKKNGQQFYIPDQCWSVPVYEDPLVRNLLPTPPLEWTEKYRQLTVALGIRSMDDAKLEDLVDILRHLPEHYPNPDISVLSAKKPVTRAISHLTRWVIRRINNIINQAENNPVPIPSFPLVIHIANITRYSTPLEPVFFADENYYSKSWKNLVPFAPVDDNCKQAAKYLGLKFLSDYIHEDVFPGEIIPQETGLLEKRFANARPYLLALIADLRESELMDTARYLSRLDFKVVDQLTIKPSLSIISDPPFEDHVAQIFLREETERRVGSGGRAPRKGTLFVHKDFASNYDLIGAPIANFIGIPGLADAFVILLDRGGKDGRMQYLKARGICESKVDEMRSILQSNGVYEKDDSEDIKIKIQAIDELVGDIQIKQGGPSPSSQSPKTELINSNQESSQVIKTLPTEINYPPLETTSLSAYLVKQIHPAQEPAYTGVSGRNLKYRYVSQPWERDQKIKDAIGKRGEELAYRWEIERLKNLGIDDAESKVIWMRETGRESADHDIESLDIINGMQVPITIEVKATPGKDFRVFMSREELECALRTGKNYRLYRIIEATSETPALYVFGNPYTLWEQKMAIIETRDTIVFLPQPDLSDNFEEIVQTEPSSTD